MGPELILGIAMTLVGQVYGDSLDLPVPPAYFGQEKKRQAEEDPPVPYEGPVETPDDDDGDDPRDTPPPVFFGEEIDTEKDTIVFVIDISGSMSNGYDPMIDYNGNSTRGSKYFKAVSELVRLIRSLSNNFHFNVVRYDCAVESWKGQMMQATDANKADAEKWILGDDPRAIPRKVPGGTMTGPATVVGLGYQPNDALVLLTDGAPNCGANGLEGHRFLILAANTGVVIDVFGIEAFGAFRTFCQNVASDSGGTYIDVP